MKMSYSASGVKRNLKAIDGSTQSDLLKLPVELACRVDGVSVIVFLCRLLHLFFEDVLDVRLSKRLK
jgi:hypothetical protein